jgi:Mrp family chromosome partitioning ATPase/capsular polysaccharide biosynthesis protein
MNVTAQPQTSSDGIDLRAYLRPIWRRKWIILTITIIAGAATFFVTHSQTKRYTATTRLYLVYSNPAAVVGGQAPTPPAAQDLLNVATLLESASRTAAANAALKLSPTANNTVVATPQTGSSFVIITVTSDSPVTAAALANTYAKQYLRSQTNAVVSEAKLLKAQAETSLHSLPPNNPSDTSARFTLLTQIRQLNTTLAAPAAASGVQQVDPATPPAVPSSPRPLRDAIFGAIIGLVLGIVVAFILELLDRRVSLVSTLESLYERTVLAVLPHARDPAPQANGLMTMAPEHIEPIRTLLVNIQVEDKEHAWKSLLITSAMPGEGKSTVARALALAYASAGQRALVVDADLRRPMMNAAFGLPASPGLSDVLSGAAGLAEAITSVPLPTVAHPGSNGKAIVGDAEPNHRGEGSVAVLPHGTPVANPAALLSSDAWQEAMDAATEEYDMVIIDSAPILTVADTIPLIDHVGMVLLVTRLGMTTRESANRIKSLFLRVPGANLVGLVANDMRDEFLDEGYGYYNYRSYTYQASNGAKQRRGVGRFTRA